MAQGGKVPHPVHLGPTCSMLGITPKLAEDRDKVPALKKQKVCEGEETDTHITEIKPNRCWSQGRGLLRATVGAEKEGLKTSQAQVWVLVPLLASWPVHFPGKEEYAWLHKATHLRDASSP